MSGSEDRVLVSAERDAGSRRSAITTGAARYSTGRLRAGSALNNTPVTTKAELRKNMPRAAISTIGTFFGECGRLETTAREMMRASAGAAAMLSRAVASRYLAR